MVCANHLEAKIKSRMVHSKKGLSTMSWMTLRVLFHAIMHQVLSRQVQKENLSRRHISSSAGRSCEQVQGQRSHVVTATHLLGRLALQRYEYHWGGSM